MARVRVLRDIGMILVRLIASPAITVASGAPREPAVLLAMPPISGFLAMAHTAAA